MCKFFSLVSAGDSKPLYFDAELRQQVKEKKLNYEPDSHTSIADYFGYKGAKEDVLNKYEYNPITRVFNIDQKNNPKDDSKDIKDFCDKLDFKLIVPELNIHSIVNPFKDFSVTKVTKEDLELLNQWASVRDSVGASVWASVWASVGDSVWDSVWASVGASVGASVWASVGVYTTTFFDIKYKYDFSSCQKLWNKGIVPSYDGSYWRLHGKDGKVIWKGLQTDMKKCKTS